MHTTLRKVGGSVMLAVPPAVLDQLDIGVGTNVSLSVDNGRLIVEPGIVPKYTLDQLLAECSPDAEVSPGDRAWTTGPRGGQELL
jgi:antitoxin ChpS